nr:MAG TPA: hypothetical protein [Caudoviricetes sp.]
MYKPLACRAERDPYQSDSRTSSALSDTKTPSASQARR